MATAQDFQTAAAFVLDEETGGDPNGALHTTPGDPGGTTKWGVSQAEYPLLDIADLSRDGALALMYQDYWVPSGAGGLDMPLAQVVLDTAFNQGVGVARQLVQESGGDVTQYLALRAQAYEHLVANKPQLAQFLPGWLERVEHLAAAIGTGAGAVAAPALVLLGVAAGLAVWYHRHTRPALAR